MTYTNRFNVNVENIFFFFILIIIISKVITKTKSRSTTNNLTEHAFNIVVFNLVVSIFLTAIWTVFTYHFNIHDTPPLNSLVIFFLSSLIPHIYYVFMKKVVYSRLNSSSSSKPSLYPFLTIPLSYLFFILLFLFNQSSDYLSDLDFLGPFFSAIKIDLFDPIADYILFYLIAEFFIITIHIYSLYSGSDKRQSYNLYCDSTSMITKVDDTYYPNYNCLNSLSIDTNLLAMLVKTISLTIYTIVLYKTKKTPV